MRRLLVISTALLALSCSNNSAENFGPTAPTSVQSALSIGIHEQVTPPSIEAEDPLRVVTGDLAEIRSLTGSGIVVSGTITDKAYPRWKISGATITVTPGTLTTRTSSIGFYSMRLRTAIYYTIKIAKTGYSTATIKKTFTGTTTLNKSLTPIKPSGATARCKDRTWSKSQHRSGTCSWHGGVAYWVCPGLLCTS